MSWQDWSGIYTYGMIMLGAGILLFWVAVISFLTGWF